MSAAEKPFEREPRYLVIKVNDALAHLSSSEIYALGEMGEKITNGRSSAGKPPLVTVVVEQDWPELEPVWEMIKARVTGKGNDARRVAACLNACEGISTENLEDNKPIIELANDYNAVLKQRDMLLDVLNKAANDLAYVAYNLDGSKLDNLKAGLSESTCPSETALIAESNCREAISRVKGGAEE